MVNYICCKCTKCFNRKSNYKHHINRKTSCVDNDLLNIPNIAELAQPESNKQTLLTIEFINNLIEIKPPTDTLIETNDNTCKYCNKTFTNKTKVTRHLKYRCKSKKSFDEVKILKEQLLILTNNINKLEIENVELKKQNINLKKQNLLLL